MKQEEFEWMKKWLIFIDSIEGTLIPENKMGGTYTLAGAIDVATEKYPPPIDEEIKSKKELTCPDCETATIGFGGEGAYYYCVLCKKRWDFDWEHPIVLNPQLNILPTVPGMKEPPK